MGIDKTFNILALGGYSPAPGEGHSEVALLSITTEPSAPFAKGSKYFRDEENVPPELNKKIYTAVADDTWTGATVTDPSYGTFYQYNGATYIWDGNTLELFELEEYQKKLVSGVNIKTINGESVLGSGNIATETHQGFNPDWTTTGTFAQFLTDIYNDTTATPGYSYLGTLRCSSGLPADFSNVEAVVEIQQGPSDSKAIHTIITSGNVFPYRWEYTSWNNGNNNSGWIGFQPQIIAGNNITIDADGKTINASVPSGVYTQDNLIAGTNTTFTQVVDPYSITSDTLVCLHLDNNLDDASDYAADTQAYLDAPYYGGYADGKFNKGLFSTSTRLWFFKNINIANNDELTIDFWAKIHRDFYNFSIDLAITESGYINETYNKFYFNNNNLYLYYANDIIKSVSIPALGTTFHHFAIELKKSEYIKVFIDGHLVETYTDDSNGYISNFINSNSCVFNAGGLTTSDEFRVSKKCLWETDFTAPTSAYARSTNTIYQINAPTMTGATALANGTSGTVPAPTIADKDKYLKGDGTWVTLSGGVPTISYYSGTGTTITIADTSSASLVKVYKNGLLLRPDNDGTIYDYSISGTTLTLTTALEATDTITLEVF